MPNDQADFPAMTQFLGKFANCVKVLPGYKVAARGSALRALYREDPETAARAGMHMCILAQTDHPSIIQNAWFIAKAHLDEFNDSSGMDYVLKTAKELDAEDWLQGIEERIS